MPPVKSPILHVLGRDDREFHQGEIFLVQDELVSIPYTLLDLRGRVYHHHRPVVILYDTPSNANPNWYTVVAAPVSHRVDMKRETDLVCTKSEGGFKRDSVIRLGLVQPFLVLIWKTKGKTKSSFSRKTNTPTLTPGPAGLFIFWEVTLFTPLISA